MDADVGPVALAVITCNGLILVGRRGDGNPPWVFPGGKIEPGESPENAAVRETLEETGLRVRATGIIGSRVHPSTGVLVVYAAAVPTEEANGNVCSRGELLEVQWAGLAEANGRMDDMSDVVRDHLQRRSQVSCDATAARKAMQRSKPGLIGRRPRARVRRGVQGGRSSLGERSTLSTRAHHPR